MRLFEAAEEEAADSPNLPGVHIPAKVKEKTKPCYSGTAIKEIQHYGAYCYFRQNR